MVLDSDCSGAISGGIVLASQLIEAGGSWDCIEWGSVAGSAGDFNSAFATGGGMAGGAAGASTGSSNCDC